MRLIAPTVLNSSLQQSFTSLSQFVAPHPRPTSARSRHTPRKPCPAACLVPVAPVAPLDCLTRYRPSKAFRKLSPLPHASLSLSLAPSLSLSISLALSRYRPSNAFRKRVIGAQFGVGELFRAVDEPMQPPHSLDPRRAGQLGLMRFTVWSAMSVYGLECDSQRNRSIEFA
jgi:hypothetical protein